MKKGSKPGQGSAAALPKSALAGLLVGLLAFAILIGVTGVAMGIGSIYPGVNLIASPIACPGRHLASSQQVTRVGTVTYYTATWSCTNDSTGERSPIDPSTVHLTAGAIYGLALFGILLLVLVLYWNSSIGPAKNDGRRLW